MANSQRLSLTNDWSKLSDGNKTVRLQVLNSPVYIYLTDSSDDPDSSADKDSFVVDVNKLPLALTTALKVYAKKHLTRDVMCEIIYTAE